MRSGSLVSHYVFLILDFCFQVLNMERQMRIHKCKIVVSLAPEYSHMRDGLRPQLLLVLHKEISKSGTIRASCSSD